MASTTTTAQPPASDLPPDRGDPLPSWNDTATKKALAFVDRVTKQGSPDFVPEAERVATFDNDGTLWAEQPMYVQVLFALERVKALAPQHPEWRDKEPFASLLKGDVKRGPMPSASGRTTASRRSVVWIRRSTKPRRRAGPSST
jgi:hypothetical protein